jgi:hypothetical protein
MPSVMVSYMRQMYAARKAVQASHCVSALDDFFALLEEHRDAESGSMEAITDEMLAPVLDAIEDCVTLAEDDVTSMQGNCKRARQSMMSACNSVEFGGAVAELVSGGDARVYYARLPQNNSEAAAKCAVAIRSFWQCVAPSGFYERDSPSVRRMLVVEQWLRHQRIASQSHNNT